jgi:lactoylglutathione lyase
MPEPSRPFRVLGLQQVAIGGLDRAPLRRLWCELLGVTKVGDYQSAAEKARPGSAWSWT